MSDDSTDVEIFCDGACLGNPGPGGWGALLRFKGNEKEISGGEAHTTNNRMELRAAIEGLNALSRPCRVAVTTDSQYVKNADLWQALDAAQARHEKVSWHWVRGHDGHAENERVDVLARNEAEKFRAR